MKPSKKIKKRIIWSLAFLVCLSAILFFVFYFSQKAEASWWNENWYYRKKISATNSSSYNAVNIPYLLILDTQSLISEGKMKSDGSDLRIVKEGGNEVRYQIEKCTLNTSQTGIWIEATVSSNSTAYYYVYYGNASAQSPVFQSDIGSVENTGYVVNMLDGFTYNTSPSYGRVSDIKKNGENLGVNGNYRHSTGYPGSWWDDRGFTKTFEASGPMFVEVRYSDSNYGSYSSYGSCIMMFKNGFISERLYMNYNTSGTDTLYYYLHFDNDTRNSVWVNESGTLVDQASNSGSLYESNLKDGWFGQRWTSDGRYGGTIIRKNGSDWQTGVTSAQSSYYQTNWSYAVAYTNGSSREVRCGTFAGDGGLSEMAEKGSLLGANSTSLSSEEKGPGPIAHWKFDEGVNNTCADGTSDACDSSAKNHDSYFYGPVWQSEDMCVSGKCVKFDGVDDYMTAGIGTDYFPLSTFTSCAWIKTPGLASGMTKNGILSITYGFLMEMNSGGNFVFQLDNGSDIVGLSDSSNLYDNKWHQLCGAYDGANLYLYVDGVLKTSAARTWSGTTRWPTNTVSIGHNNNNPPFYKFNGMMDDIKIYDYFRTSSQIKADYAAGISGSSSGVSVSLGNNSEKSLSDGLVGYWKMDESSWNGTSGEVIDYSGNNNNGTSSGSPAKASGKFGLSGSFDGNNDYFEVADSASISPGGAFTFSTWVYQTASCSGECIIFNKENEYEWRISNGTIDYAINNTNPGWTWINTGISISQNTWTHLVMTYDSSAGLIRAYLNGELSYTRTSSTGSIYDAGNALRVAARGAPSEAYSFFGGKLDEVRIYNRALSEYEIRNLYKWAPGPVAYYNFEEGSGTSTVYDRSGNGYNGSIGGSMTQNDWVLGKYGSALEMDGTDDYVYISSLAWQPKNFTVGWWLNPYSLANWNHQMLGGGSWGYFVFHTNSSGGVYVGTDVTNRLTPTQVPDGTIVVNQWQYLTFTYENGTGKFYKNGILIGSKTGLSDPLSWSGFYIGTTNTNTIHGKVDEVKIYNYARNQEQILEDMGGGKILKPWFYLDFEEGYGTVVKDRGMASDNGDLTDGPLWTMDGAIGKAITLDGTNDTVQNFISNNFEYWGGDMSVSVWVKPNSNSGYVISKPWNGGGDYNYRIHVGSGGIVTLDLKGSVEQSFSTTETISNGSWHNIVVTLEGATKKYKIYLDGKLSKQGTHSISSWTPPNGDGNISLCIGSLYPYGAGWGGVDWMAYGGGIDEVKFFKYVLDLDSVKIEYNKGAQISFGAQKTSSETWDAGGFGGNMAAGYWNFEEGSGTTGYDRSNNSNNLTITNATYSLGKPGWALNFSGNGYARTNYKPSADFTYSCWVKMSSLPVGNPYGVIGATNNASGVGSGGSGITNVLGIDSSGYPNFYTYNAAYQRITSSTAIQAGTWHHLSAVNSTSGGMQIYLDGELVATDPTKHSGQYLTYSYVSFSADHETYGYQFFNGLIDEVKIYNYARTGAQIAFDYNKGKPIAWWSMDDGEGTRVNDKSGKSNTGTMTNMDTSSDWLSGTSCKYNGCLDFDGTDDYVNAGTGINIANSSFSVSAWAKRRAIGGSHMLFGQGTITNNNGLHVGFRSTNEFTCAFYGNDLNTPQYTDTDWHHWTCTYDALTNERIIYRDGVAVASGTASADYQGTGQFNFGKSYSTYSSGYFNGQIDDARVYNYVLSPSQVKEAMNDALIRFE